MFRKDSPSDGLSASFGKKQDQDTTESVIGPSVHLEGNFNSSGNVIIIGSLTGSMTTSGNVRIEEGAVVQATVASNHIFVAGEVRGDLHALEQIELAPTAKIIGNVETKILSVAPGAILHGKCSMKNVSNKLPEYDPKKSKMKKGAGVDEKVLEEITA